MNGGELQEFKLPTLVVDGTEKVDFGALMELPATRESLPLLLGTAMLELREKGDDFSLRAAVRLREYGDTLIAVAAKDGFADLSEANDAIDLIIGDDTETLTPDELRRYILARGVTPRELAFFSERYGLNQVLTMKKVFEAFQVDFRDGDDDEVTMLDDAVEAIEEHFTAETNNLKSIYGSRKDVDLPQPRVAAIDWILRASEEQGSLSLFDVVEGRVVPKLER